MAVQALIQAAGRGLRLGLGPKAFVVLEGQTLLERAVELVHEFTQDIIIAVDSAEITMAHDLLAGYRVRIIAGGSTRSETTRKLIDHATGEWLILHDVVHPLVSRGLIKDLLKTAYEYGCAAPAISNTEFLYDHAGTLVHAPGDVFVGQKPIVFSRAIASYGYRYVEQNAMNVSDPSFIKILEASGVKTKFIEGGPDNIKITTAKDLKIARALIQLRSIDAQATGVI